MNQEIENLNGIYNQELRHFISSINFSYMKTVEKDIIQKIEDYFNINFRGIISFNNGDFEDKIRENFEYGIERTEQLSKEIHPINFNDLEGRTTSLIDEYLTRRNYDNKNYEKYRYEIKSYIKKIIEKEKEEMIFQTKNNLDNQNQNLEKEVLNGYKNILLTINTNLEENLEAPINQAPILEPVLDLPLSNETNPGTPITPNEELPGNFLK